MEQAEAIRAARTGRRMTQAHLAEASSVSSKTVIRAETGRPVSDENLRSICSVLGLDAAALARPRPAEALPEADDVRASSTKPGRDSLPADAVPPSLAVVAAATVPTRRRMLEALGIVALAGGSGFAGGYAGSGPAARREAASPVLAAQGAGMPTTERGFAEVSAWISTAVARAFAIDFAG